MFCNQCGKEIKDGQDLCEECKSKINNKNVYTANATETGSHQTQKGKSKIAAGLLGIFLGAFGVHNFYLGYTGKAVAQLLITILSCGMLAFASSIWGLIEGILILTGSITTDAEGNPLSD